MSHILNQVEVNIFSALCVCVRWPRPKCFVPVAAYAAAVGFHEEKLPCASYTSLSIQEEAV